MVPEWIDVKERKPPIGKRVVLLSIHKGWYFIGKGVFHGRVYEYTDGALSGYAATCVRYWLPEGKMKYLTR